VDVTVILGADYIRRMNSSLTQPDHNIMTLVPVGRVESAFPPRRRC
jgi:hypothetical protein